MDTPRIGLIGVGLMGHGIALNLARKGHALTVLDHPGNQPLGELLDLGATTAPDVQSLARGSDVLLLCVTGSPQVEAVLLGHPGVAGAAVLGLPHPHWIEAVCAFVVKKPGAEVDEESILTHCRERLGGFEVPKLVRFVEALPATATGKVQKHLLRQQFAELARQAWGEEVV